MAAALSLYWVMGWTIATGLAIQEPAPERIRLCIIMYLVGLALMIGADAQKTFTLKYKKGIDSKIFRFD